MGASLWRKHIISILERCEEVPSIHAILWGSIHTKIIPCLHNTRLLIGWWVLLNQDTHFILCNFTISNLMHNLIYALFDIISRLQLPTLFCASFGDLERNPLLPRKPAWSVLSWTVTTPADSSYSNIPSSPSKRSEFLGWQDLYYHPKESRTHPATLMHTWLEDATNLLQQNHFQ